MKPDTVKIIQLLTQGSATLGLGDDGVMYKYSYADQIWNKA